MESTIKPRLSERINLRMLVFIGVAVAIIGYPVYVLIDAQFTKGIRQLANGYAEVDLEAMSMLTLDQRDGVLADLPEQWQALNGKKIVARGELIQTQFIQPGFADYDLCYSRRLCDRRPLQAQRFMQLKPLNGTVIKYDEGIVKMTGTLHVEVKKIDNRVASIFQLAVDSVELAK